MKKYGKFFKKAALTAAICLGLSQSVWAMPSGGAVAEGTVSGFAANPASGAEFTVTGGPAIINWGAFGIAANESMSFNTAGGALLNQVTGGNMSQILGTLTQTGANPMFLVNPAGIVVGPGATINANQLVLSALAIKDQDFLSGNYNFAAASGTAGTLQILGKDTKINVSADTSERTGFFGGWGKTVEVADGVTFTLEHSILDLEAGKKLVLPIHNGSVSSIVEAGGENKASFVGSSVIGSQSHAGKLKIGGGYVNLEDSTITLQSGSVSNDVFLQARSSSDSGNVQRATDNVVVLKNANISIDGDMSIKGGKVNIQGSTTLSSGQTESNPDSIDNGPATRLEILAAQSTENGRYLMTPENTITADGLTISKAQTVHVIGGKVDLSNSKINVANTYDKDDVEIRALPGMMYTTGVKTYPILAPASGEAKDYSVTLTNTNVTLETSGDTDPSIDIGGGVVTLDGATVTLTGGNDNGINIYAVSDVTGQESNETMTATAVNLVAIKGGSTLESKGQRLEIGAGAVSVTEGSTVSADKTFIVANTQLGFDQTTNFVVSKGTKGNITIGSKSTILPSTGVLDGKIVYVDDPDNPQPQPEPQPVVVNTNLPTGGKLASGGVTVNDAAWTAGDLENNSVVATKSNSIINWGTFNIEKGYGLTFNTDGGALLNRVTGGKLSSIYGTLTQKGKEPMFLVNPAGILVGDGAIIDANALVLSTLSMTDNGFKDAENDKLVLGEKGSNPGPLTIEKGANVTASDHLGLYGGTVTVADGVNFDLGSELSMTAAQRFSAIIGNTAESPEGPDYTIGSAGFRPNGIDAASSNVLSVGNNEITAPRFAFLAGGAVNLRSTTVRSDNLSVFSAASSRTVPSARREGLEDVIYTAGTDNAITLKNAALVGDSDLNVIGGKVDIEDSLIRRDVTDGGADGLDIAAEGEYWNFADGDAANRPLGEGHTLTVKNSRVTFTGANEDMGIFMGGGKVTLDQATVASDNRTFIAAFNDDRGTEAPMTAGNDLVISNKSDIHADNDLTLLGYTASVSDSALSGGEVQLAAGYSGEEKDYSFSSIAATDANTVTAKNMTLTANEDMDIVGGKIDIEGSALAQASSGRDLDIVALGDYDAAGGYWKSKAPDASRTLTLKDTTLNYEDDGDGYIFMGAGKVTLDKATATSNNGIIMVSSVGGSGDTRSMQEGTALTVRNNSTVSADNWMQMFGYSAEVSNSALSAGEDFRLAAGKTVTFDPNKQESDPGAVTGGTAGVGNAVTLSGATVDAQSIQIFGGKVDITDGSAITETNTTNKSDLTIMAAPGFISPEGEDGIDPDFSNPSGAASSYAVNVKDSSITLNTSGSTGDPSIDIGAGKVTLDNAKVTLTGGEDNGIEIFAISGMDGKDLIADTSNTITLKNGSIVDSQGERLALVAGKIAIGDESEVSAKNDANGALRVIASDRIGWEETGLSTDVPVMKGAQNEIAVSKDSRILQNGVDVTDQIATTRNLIDPVNPAPPDPAPTSKENIDNGREVMEAVLEENETPEKRASATENLVNNINNSSASDTVKAAQVTGMMQGILASDISDSEKVTLQREIISTFTPTKQATAEANNAATSAAQHADNAAPTSQNTAATTGAPDLNAPNNGSEESPVSGL